ncbi:MULTISPECIES: LysE/ArgO family amino acid transporter [Vibrio]|uniref:Putative amino acid transporter n=1 Tax=Vibrio halioticoli NBRC 102217 TaxID=1219072 RepID=V5FGW0_9VIBR|nr:MULTISPECIES: LysE/ArgO family amino acid transporter [Vibrio]MPW35332.1 amino acid transporter [Vibrio sp. B1Z05]GAD88287.1 putative amino acid transporter [Vibrio halioticoli NBRC 102217]
MSPFFAGLSIGLSLILAIGAQNAFVIKQGLMRQHVFWVCLVCACSDALLIFAGVAGFSVVVKAYPQVEDIARYAGALFLIVYGLSSLWSAFRNKHTLDPTAKAPSSLAKTLAVCLAFTWLNPHVYLDTLVFLGSVSTQYGADKYEFGLGAVCASFIFFFSLGYGARLLTPYFKKAHTWKVLEGLVGVTMLLLAFELLRN